MTKIFNVPFATQGDRTAIPDDVQADGAVSYTQGYGYDYERDQATDPAAKDIEREKMNSIFHDITGAVGELQAFGQPVWQEAGKPYAIRAVVYHNKKAWQSKIENNNATPAAGTEWAELKADLTAGDTGAYSKTETDQKFQPLGNYQAAGYGYSKAESDKKYQEAGYSYPKAESDKKYLKVTDSIDIDTVYPVGVVIFFAQNKNPNDLFPNTKWTYIGENKTIRLASVDGKDILSTGGNDSVALSVANMPAHGHSFSGKTSDYDYGVKTTNISGSHSHTVSAGFNQAAGTGSTDSRKPTNQNGAVASSLSGEHSHSINMGVHAHSFNGNTGSSGNGSQITIVNSYIMLMGWYRIS